MSKPDVFKIGKSKFTLIAVWKEGPSGDKTFQGYMLWPHDKEPPQALSNKEQGEK